MSLKRYEVEINGVKTALLLSDQDAKSRGLKAAEEPKEAKAPANKAAPKSSAKGNA